MAHSATAPCGEQRVHCAVWLYASSTEAKTGREPEVGLDGAGVALADGGVAPGFEVVGAGCVGAGWVTLGVGFAVVGAAVVGVGCAGATALGAGGTVVVGAIEMQPCTSTAEIRARLAARRRIGVTLLILRAVSARSLREISVR